MGLFVKKVKMNDSYMLRPNAVGIAVTVLLIVGFITLLSCIKTVPTGYTGILTTFGKVEDQTVSAGVHLISNTKRKTQK